MSKLNTKFTAPTDIYWNGLNSQSSRVFVSADAVYGSGNDGTFGYITWESKWRTYQVRWRYHARTKPTSTKPGEWKPWSAWTGWQTCTNASTDAVAAPTDSAVRSNWDKWDKTNARRSTGSTTSTRLFNANAPWYTHYVKVMWTALGVSVNGTVYDDEEFEVEVRAYNEGTKEHGPTCRKVLGVHYRPTVNVTKVVLNNDNSLQIFYNSDWNRNSNTFEVSPANKPIVAITDCEGNVNGERSFTLPASALDRNYDITDPPMKFKPEWVNMTTGKGVIAYAEVPDGGWPVQSRYSGGTDNPTLEIIESSWKAHRVRVKLSTSTATYLWKDVTCTATWTTPKGVQKTVSPTRTIQMVVAAGSAKDCRWEFTNVPSDIEVTYKVGYICSANDASGSKFKTLTHTLKSNGATFFSFNGHVAGLYLDAMEYEETFAANHEAEVCAGRAVEVVHHGVGGVREMKYSGRIPDAVTGIAMEAPFRMQDWLVMKDKVGCDGTVSMARGRSLHCAMTNIDISGDGISHTVSVTVKEDA